MKLDVLIVGGGPAGMACAIDAGSKGLSYVIVEKGCLTNSIYNFPADMTFFSTPELLQVGELAFICQSFRPNRIETLNYYRAVKTHYDLNIRTYENVESVTPVDGRFTVTSTTTAGETREYDAGKVIVATGYYDHPNTLGIEGEELPKVSHYYTEAHPYNDCDVAIIGGKNSAVEAALTFYRVGARVTLIHRGLTLSDSVKYWVRPEIEKRIEDGKIATIFNSEVTKIETSEITIRNNSTGKTSQLDNDFLFALTGYHPDVGLLKSCGVQIDEATMAPKHNPETLETNVPGLYVAGSIVAGTNNNKVFIENSREHGKLIFA